MAYSVSDVLTNVREIAFNTDQLLDFGLGQAAMLPTQDYNFIQVIPPAPPAPPATQVVNYVRQAPLPAPLGTVRQLTILYDAAGNISTITRTI